jgi:hypothetical protein
VFILFQCSENIGATVGNEYEFLWRYRELSKDFLYDFPYVDSGVAQVMVKLPCC